MRGLKATKGLVGSAVWPESAERLLHSVRRSRTLFLLAAGLMFGATSIQAITVNYTLTGSLGAVMSGGDILGLAGKPVSISGTVDSVTLHASLQVSLGGLAVSLSNVSVSFAAGTPGSISLSGLAQGGIPVSAVIRLNLASSTPAPFPAQPIVGGSLTYGTSPTVIAIASGSVTATSNAPSIAAAPTALTFTTQSGSTPASQTVVLSAPTSVPFTAKGNDSWVTVSPASGDTGSSGTLTVSLNGATLPSSAGTYTSGVTITSNSAANSGFVIPITVTVTSGNALIPSPSSLAFVFQIGGTAPPSQSISVGSSGAALTFTAKASTVNGGGWLSVAPGGGSTPSTLSVSVDAGKLGPGTYSGTVTLTPSSGSAVQVPVGFTIAASTNLTAQPSTLTFSSGVGTTAPPAQTVAIGSKGAQTAFNVSVSTSNGKGWLSATPASATTPSNLSVAVNPSGLALGTYAGTITVSSGGGDAPLIIPVSYVVSNEASFEVTPASLSFTGQVGTAGPGAQTLRVGGSGNLSFTSSFSSTSGGPWFSMTPSSGTAPANLTVSVNLGSLAAGAYSGSITITPGSGSPITIPVNLTVTTIPALMPGKSALAFAYEVGAEAPAARTVSLGSTGSPFVVNATGFTNTGGPWLTASPSTSSTPGNLEVSVDPTALSPGVYTGTVSLSAPAASNRASSVAVVLSISTTSAIAAAPNALTFTAQAGAPAPPPQVIDLASTGASIPVTTAASVLTGASWLSVTPASTAAPGSATVSVNTSGLAVGVYSGSISLAYGAGDPLVLPVNLSVNPPAPIIHAITDGASFVSGPLAPLSLFSIWGDNLGPKTPAQLELTGSGLIGNTLADTQVLVNGVPAPLLMVSANQINAIIPGATPVGSSASIQVVHQGAKSDPVTLQVAQAAPAIFSANSSGQGQGAILNADTSYNSAQNPAAAGSLVSIFLDGAGTSTPAQADGSITTQVLADIPKLNQTVSVLIGGNPAEISYAGPAPGAVAGLTQVNARIPAGTPSGPASVTVSVGTVISGSGITVAVK
ncbi:MAG TPA: IPT/TIG domain-containing protein [Bryobacteraceae bacterium]|nr:IPT/TIG domain-containing protein [Bryobacteraceae bacterium]